MTNLDYDDARWYDPANGVFKSPDPIEFNGGDTTGSWGTTPRIIRIRAGSMTRGRP